MRLPRSKIGDPDIIKHLGPRAKREGDAKKRRGQREGASKTARDKSKTTLYVFLATLYVFLAKGGDPEIKKDLDPRLTPRETEKDLREHTPTFSSPLYMFSSSLPRGSRNKKGPGPPRKARGRRKGASRTTGGGVEDSER